MKEIFSYVRISLPIIFVAALTLLLLSYVGRWEASRQYTVFQASKLATQGEIVKNSIESYLQAGLPITQYSGFQQLSETLITSDAGIEHITITDNSKTVVFFNWRSEAIATDSSAIDVTSETFQSQLKLRNYKVSDTKLRNKNYAVNESDSSIKLTLPVFSKFGQAGELVIEASKSSMFQVFDKQYNSIFVIYGVLLLSFAAFTICYEFLAKRSKHKRTVLKSMYILSFLIMLSFILVTVFQIYEQGAQAKTKALTDSMVARLNSILELKINIEDIEGINNAFTNYKKSNPDIREIALIEGGDSKYHTDLELVGKRHSSPSDAYEYLVELKSPAQQSQKLFVSVSLPVDIVHDAVLSSANAFITLVIACGLISLIFIDASTGMTGVLSKEDKEPKPTKEKNGENEKNTVQPLPAVVELDTSLRLIKPAYFLIVFVHALSISFLPTMVSDLANNSTSSFATISLPFTLYYAMFALVLIPAGQYAEKGSLKLIMVVGAILELIGLLVITITSDYWLLILARAFSGAGQGLFLIGLQSYLLVVTPKEFRTQGAAVKVIGRNAGLISGTAIGALIFSFTNYTTVFIIASALSILGMIYLWMIVPDVIERRLKDRDEPLNESADKKPQQSFSKLFHNIAIVFKDSEFVKSLLLVAMPGKMAITGVIMFATPLLLTSHGFEPGEIGQALMLYYIASIVMTHYASRLVDSLDISRSILIASTVIGGASIIILGFSDVTEWNGSLAYLGGEQVALVAIAFNQLLNQSNITWIPTAVIMGSLILAGIANGLLTSPVVTHINKTKVAKKYGIKSVTATYTFLERGGHVLGPLLIGYSLTLSSHSNIALSLFGIFIIFSGILFVLFSRKI